MLQMMNSGYENSSGRLEKTARQKLGKMSWKSLQTSILEVGKCDMVIEEAKKKHPFRATKFECILSWHFLEHMFLLDINITDINMTSSYEKVNYRNSGFIELESIY